MSKFQKFFLENNKKLLLKFDGFRDEKLYTVGLVDFYNSKNNKIVDTKRLIGTTTNIILLNNLELDGMYSVLNYFIELNTKLNSEIKEQLVFSLSVEYSPKLNIDIYILVGDIKNDNLLLKRFDSEVECKIDIEQFINKYTQSIK